MFTKKMYIIVGIVLSAWIWAVSFAGNTVSDIPTSSTENRTIQAQTTLYTDSCDISQDLAFYDNSPVVLRVAQPRGPVNYSFDKAETYVRVYGGNVFGANLKFPYITNVVPSTVLETNNVTIITTEAANGIFSWWATTTPRNQIVGQIVTKNMERSLILNNTNGSNINYYYRRASDYTSHNGTIKALINANLTKKTSCTNYYLAKCWDGIVDKPTGSTDGNGGIQTQSAGFVAWNAQSTWQNEVCDEGALNGTAGHCNKDCTGIGTGTNTGTLPGNPTCSLTVSTTAITAGQAVTLNVSYTSGTSATFSPSLTGLTSFTYPVRSESNLTDAPATTTTYTLTVNGDAGTTPAVCSTTVTVTPPVPHLQCTLTFSPSVAASGQIVSVGWNVSNWNFFWTNIYVAPALGGAWPHWVNANQYNGVSSVMATHTGQYVFSMLVNNNTEQNTCTWILNVVDDIQPCSLTTTTPTILPGQTAILNGSYSNGVLATITPNIPGLNLVYPNRSNTTIAVTPTTTTTYTMNVLWVFWSGTTCSTKITVLNTGVTLNKSLVTNVLYHSGDLVTFKIDFANHGVSTVYNVIVSDYLPASLDYVTSQIVGVSPYTVGTWTNGGNQFVEYSWFSLTAGQQGYLLVTGKFKGYQYTNQTLNNSFLKSDETQMLYSSALFYVYSPTANVSITKTSNKPSYYPGEDARFTLAVTNNSLDPVSNVQITDTWPTSSCITLDPQWTSNMPFTVVTTSNPYTWAYNGSLAVGQTLYLYLTGHITNSPTCIANYTNNASTLYTMSNGTIQSWNAQPLWFPVSTSPNSTMVFEKKITQYGNKSGDPVTFELLYTNNGNATITNYDITDYWPGTLNFVSATPMPTTQTPNSWGTILHWIFTPPLAPNWSGKIIVNWTIR